MRTAPNCILPISFILLLLGLSHGIQAHADESSTEEVHEIIAIGDVPLTCVIQNVARRMDLNVIFDPHVPGSAFGPGRDIPEPTVIKRWTNITASEALRIILKENQLILVSNPVTRVARVAPGHIAIRPVPEHVLGMDSETNKPVPLVVIDDVPLLDAIKHTAKLLGLSVTFDPEVSDTFTPDCAVVRVRWENLTSRQVLAALLDNYGLVMREDPSTATMRIRLKNRNQTVQERKGTRWFRW